MLQAPNQTQSLTNRRRWTDVELTWVWTSCDGLCFYCRKRLSQSNYGNREIVQGYKGWEVDHFSPFASTLAEPNHYSNLVASCWECNVQKSHSLAGSKRAEWWLNSGLTPRCLKFTKKGYRCKRDMCSKNYKFCEKHSGIR